MTPFKMKILGYNAGAYSVEYIPENTLCKPIKLNIQLDADTLTDKEEIVERLKASSPQDYWYNQVMAGELNQINEVASSLVNTTHAVQSVHTMPVNPVNSFSFHPRRAPLRGPDIEAVALPESTAQAMQEQQAPMQVQHGRAVRGSSSPEQVASPEEQNIIKLKILIQQVIQEMAEGTV